MIEINGRKIGEGFPPYIIAELSANHNGSLDKAKETIEAAKKSGAHAVKIQTYTADTMTINSKKKDFLIKKGLWSGYKLYDLYKEASTPYEWHIELFNFAQQLGITIFSTPFDESAGDLLKSLHCPAFKIASFELTDLPLLKYIASFKKPILISTGMGSEDEIGEAVETLRNNGCNEILLFHCISSYPAPTSESNIKLITKLKEKFQVEVGLSDHTLNNTAALSAISLGASAIEKHFILSRKTIGPDSSFSIEPEELKQLVKLSKDCWDCLGNGDFERSLSENENRIFRRSIYFVKDLKKGEKISFDSIRRIRPGFGLHPKYFDQLINKVLMKDVQRGDRVSWDLLQ